MNKWIKGAAASLLVLALSACGSGGELQTAVEAEGDNGKDEQPQKEDPFTAEEVFQKSLQASESINSMHADLTIHQDLKTTGDEALHMKNDITATMDVVTEPQGLHQKMVVNGDAEGSMDIEMYGAGDELYLQTPDMGGEWLSVPVEMHDELLDGMNGSNAMIDLDIFQDFEKQFTLEEKEDEYILNLSASGDEFSDLLKELMNQSSMGTQELDEDGSMENVEVKKIELALHIDKETYYTNSFDMKLDAIMELEGYRTVAIQSINAKMSQVNELDEIAIPEEVRNNAFDMNAAGLGEGE